ncbi:MULTISPECIES: quinone oxidoreductase [unclassified Bacillus (in: firmicutes)]|uniref:quinone oxidoreductase family protein n=1 Tax=unclassified Bacillus (in: firmicutes) TaxID=185979 RepID=UPI000BF0218B|nr:MULTISPECIES: quinone oxidoreductase [unclassified Bacillus (in: firmicutes)]PEJ56229.1 alcohol dehydrogenase [Bacillus sp. AFS002410]PEL10561.1 alcohol dehydrogenase [Bacillus sp. AFS017336]
MKALVFREFGQSDVLKYEEIQAPNISTDEVLIEMKAVGVNFADIYRRKGNYHLAGDPPYILGYEGSGVITEVGSNITDYKVGDRVAFADVPFANAEYVAAKETHIVPIPDEISFEIAASIMLQGLTAHYLINDSYKIKAGDVALVHAVAGGVGQLLTQMIRLKGGEVIGLTSSTEKRDKALSIGAKEVFLYNEDWVSKVKEKNGVDVVYESVGSTIMDSFEATKIHGTVVFYGMAGGDPVHIDPRMLMDTSKTLTGGDLWNVLISKEERLRRSNELFNWISTKQLIVQEPTVFPLKDGKLAHDLLESRKSTGKIILSV